jgi:Coenzyme F420-reducing hydrogenase, alpha subunit
MSDTSMHIEVHHVTRVEGHGNIVVDINNGSVKKLEWQVPEAPRFFESMVVGRHFSEVATITSRICGICSISHTFSSLKATETALGVRLSEQADLLRRILLWAELLQSHVLHIGYLAAPDLLKVNSVIPLIGTHKEVVLLVIKLHRLANETCDIIGGRTTHPIRTTVGGWTMLPKAKELETLKKRWQEAIGDMKKLADVVASLAPGLPNFTRETEYVSLLEQGTYAHYDGLIKSTDVKQPLPLSKYRSVTNEYMVAQSTAKWAKFNRASYMVGALARFNNNHAQLTPASRAIASQLGLSAPNFNPFMNTVAQAVECVNALENSIQCAELVLDKGIKEEKITVSAREGQGANAVEAPRGILFHDYTYDKNGICVKANCIIPTNQNHANIQKDMEKLVPEFKDRGKDALQLMLEMLVRAYDPCISCSTHYLDVKFV